MDMLSFYTDFRRYAVGRYGPHFFFLHNQGWSPPTGQFLTLCVYGIVTTLIGVLVMLWIWFAKDLSEVEEPQEAGPTLVA
jgi:hypothetical protein